MTRKEKLMDLMVRKEKAALGEESKELGQISKKAATAEAQTNQLRNLLAESNAGNSGMVSKGQLASNMWFGNAIATQLVKTEEQQQKHQALLQEARLRVAKAEQRVRIYGEKAQETRREARAEADAKEDARLSERGVQPK